MIRQLFHAEGAPRRFYCICARLGERIGQLSFDTEVPMSGSSSTVCRVALAGLLTLTLSARESAAEPIPLATAAISSGGTVLRGAPSGRFIFAATPIASVQLFEEHLLTPADVGTTFIADAGNDPDFAEVARQLTNTVGNYVETQFATAGGIAGVGYPNEGVLFGLSTLDLAGSTITAFTFRLDAFTAAPFNDTLDMLAIRGVLSVLGTNQSAPPAPTPEPASLVLLGAGAAAVLARQRSRRT